MASVKMGAVRAIKQRRVEVFEIFVIYAFATARLKLLLIQLFLYVLCHHELRGKPSSALFKNVQSILELVY